MPPTPESIADIASRLREDAIRQRASRKGEQALFRLHARLARLRNGSLWEIETTSAQLRVLEALVEHSDSSLSDLAVRLDLTRQAIHGLVHRLVRAGYLELPARRRGDRSRLVPKLAARHALCIEAAVRSGCRFWREGTTAFQPKDLEFTAMAIDRIWRELRPLRADES